MAHKGIPDYVTELLPASERRVDDSLFWMSGYLLPEVREPLWPNRSFPVQPDEPDPDEDAAADAQAMGLQYTLFMQHRRERGFGVKPPINWDRNQLLWTDLPVFAEEPCEWHYPKLQIGYNVAQIEPPSVLRPDCNTPEIFGFMPNGDLLAYWAIAEPLADEFELDIEAVHSSVDGCCLVTARGVDEDTLLETPVGQGVESGIILSRAELGQLDEAVAWIEARGGTARRFMPPDDFMFYRLAVPVMRSEMNMNRYVETFFEALDCTAERLAGFSFRILDAPNTRELPIFATERGNLVVSNHFIERLSGLLRKAGAPEAAGHVLPIVRTP